MPTLGILKNICNFYAAELILNLLLNHLNLQYYTHVSDFPLGYLYYEAKLETSPP